MSTHCVQTSLRVFRCFLGCVSALIGVSGAVALCVFRTNGRGAHIWTVISLFGVPMPWPRQLVLLIWRRDSDGEASKQKPATCCRHPCSVRIPGRQSLSLQPLQILFDLGSCYIRFRPTDVAEGEAFACAQLFVVHCGCRLAIPVRLFSVRQRQCRRSNSGIDAKDLLGVRFRAR